MCSPSLRLGGCSDDPRSSRQDKLPVQTPAASNASGKYREVHISLGLATPEFLPRSNLSSSASPMTAITMHL
jgi:hypothetical protein